MRKLEQRRPDEEAVSAEGGAQDEAAHSEVATDDGSEGGG
jgi:hypothetical protein